MPGLQTRLFAPSLILFVGCIERPQSPIQDDDEFWSLTHKVDHSTGVGDLNTVNEVDVKVDLSLASDMEMTVQPDAVSDAELPSDQGVSGGDGSPVSEWIVVSIFGDCDPNPPHHDDVGMVCAYDNTPQEAYCIYNEIGQMVCARHPDGGPCQSVGGPPSSADAEVIPDAITEPAFSITPLESTDPLARFFTQEAQVFGVRLVATASVPAAKLSHAATIMAEYLDHNEDGEADDALVVEAMIANQALLVMFASSSELERSGIFESRIIDDYWGQDLYADETNIPGRFDATLEEVLHLISTAGYATVYPEALGVTPDTLLTDAMDLARGGRFTTVPEAYPDGAWYHYDDQTCEYGCMATEYLYWALTTLLGAQESPRRCAEIAREWEPCTAAQLEMQDPAVHRLLTDPQYHLPSVLPDGVYRGQ